MTKGMMQQCVFSKPLMGCRTCLKVKKQVLLNQNIKYVLYKIRESTGATKKYGHVFLGSGEIKNIEHESIKASLRELKMAREKNILESVITKFKLFLSPSLFPCLYFPTSITLPHS